MRKPARLQPGDTIGIAAPSGPFPPEELDAAITLIQARGYKVQVGVHALSTLTRCDYLAGDDAQRAEDLHTLFERDDIAAVFSARGGYGAMRLFPLLNTELLGAHPKIFTGYSDITSLHLALNQQAQVVTFHGPNAAALPRLDALSTQVFWHLLESDVAYGTLPAPVENISTLVGGTAEGMLAGGNLCLLAHACGSRFTPDFSGKIVLLEDVGEAVYRVDRDMTQLRNAGIFDTVAGFVIGNVTNWRKEEKEGSRNSLEFVWRDILAPLGKPTIVGYPFGHEPNPLTLPLGATARLDADKRTLTLLQSAVV